jgi:hypothetical protein
MILRAVVLGPLMYYGLVLWPSNKILEYTRPGWCLLHFECNDIDLGVSRYSGMAMIDWYPLDT